MKKIFFTIENDVYVVILDFMMDRFYVRLIDLKKSSREVPLYSEKVFGGTLPCVDEEEFLDEDGDPYDWIEENGLEDAMKKDQEDNVRYLVMEVLSFKYGNAPIRKYDTWEKAWDKIKDSIEVVSEDKPTLDEVILPKETKDKLYQIVRLLNNNEKYAKIGAKVEKGMLLSGLPGTGKTRAMECLANEIDAKFILKCGSEFAVKYVGVGGDNVRKLFEEARKHKKAIIFIDEVDAVGGKRGEDNNKERDTTLNQLLVEISKIKPNENIFVVGATNHKELLDEAITRSGRLSIHLEIPMPDEECREKIFELYINKLVHTDDMNFNEFSILTEGLSGADIEFICNQAAINVVDDDRDIVTMQDILNQIEDFKKSRNMEKKKEKQCVGFRM